MVTSGTEAEQELARHEAVDAVSFTGSDTAGRAIMALPSGTVKKLVLELGGKPANIVLDNAHLDAVVDDVVSGVTNHSGQVCATRSRILLHESVVDEVVERIGERLGTVRVDEPEDVPAAVASRLRSGMVGLNGASRGNPNAPFGGYKPSGLGRERGEMGMAEFLETKSVTWRVL